MTVVAIDGPSGAGKSTVAKAVARALGWIYLDTGAMYRTVGLLAEEAGVALDDEAAVTEVACRAAISFDAGGRVFAGERDVSAAIRTLAAGTAASRVSVLPAVRRLLVERQRELGRGVDIVMEGRDIGTNVFPQAEVKIFLGARPDIRAARRCAELRACGEQVDEAEVLAAVIERDRRDSGRAVAPLCAAADAVEIDSSTLPFDRVVEWVLRVVAERTGRTEARCVP